MVYSSILAALLGLPLLASAFHNVTYNDNDPALVYRPAGSWLDWRPSGCLSWPGGQYTTDSTGSVTLDFYGVAVYIYGVFDDASNPIYTITIDNGTAVEQGRGINADPRSCKPIFSKTGLTADNHTIVFSMTDTRPGDVKDLSLEGFIVTVPDAGDPTTSDNNGSPKKINIAVIAGAAGGGVALILIAVGIFCFCRSRKNRAKGPSHQMIGSSVPLVGQYPPPTMADPSIPAPTPFILPPAPPAREPSPYYPPSASPWSPAPSSDNNTYYTGASSVNGPMVTPANDAYNRPYPSPGTPPIHANQPYYAPPSNAPGLNGVEQNPYAQMTAGQSTQHNQYNSGYGDYSHQGQQQQNQYTAGYGDFSQSQQQVHVWNAASSHGGTGTPPPATEASYSSYTAASASTTTQPTYEAPPRKYGKGAVDPNAAPVVRNENAELQRLGSKRESQGGEAPPPEYVPYS
ncbi:hypothetical protein M408DRAFT_327366 [Serendipita vermifera MAFF 305830]|uniref:Mid2 domain-containing protein n=1 Tax=Serendipita vermifera MAFF 305830 TaxID=933852 RepID=A0A0C3BIP5_SERVB|nr:hypothetical protein M408DRAFT_327366 [Serendipita vermifera MAFF 305830]